jgi:inner membrane protein
MDPITHTLTGLTLARAGADRLGPYATATILVAANVPDLGLLYLLGGGAPSLEQPMWTHSLVGGVALGAAVGLVFWRQARHKPRPPHMPKLVLTGALGALSHLLLDWSTALGLPLLWPFHNPRYALDWFPGLDLWLLLILLLGLSLPMLFHLIAEEIGARRSPAGPRRGAWMALVACLLLAAGRYSLHSQAVAQLESRLYNNRSPLRAGAFPTAFSPFRWRGVVETGTTFEVADMSLLATGRAFETFSTHYKPEPSPALEAALASRAGQAFLSWARFPQAEVVPAVGGGWQVKLENLRYTSGGRSFYNFSAHIELDASLQVREEAIRRGGNSD